MKTEQILAIFPGSNNRPEIKNELDNAADPPNFGVARMYFNMSEYPAQAKERFAGIDSISITVFDGNVAEMRIEYLGPNSRPEGPGWPNLDEFISKLSEAFGLPKAEDWLWKPPSKSLKCLGFEIVVSNPNYKGSISMRNADYVEAVRKRYTEEEERRRRKFKP